MFLVCLLKNYLAAELSFAEKLSLLGEEAKRKLASLFGSGDAPRFNNPTSYRSLPTLDDETKVLSL